MSDVVIRTEGLGKRYQIGRHEAPYKTLRESLTGMAVAPARKLRSLARGEPFRREPETIWALKDVDLEVRQGEVLGIVGRNGAGKSTLLKILAHITEPTAGRVELRGRVGSLLEVGTGFHPELTGRENIYLNGAILGMRKAEIDRRFDEIVSFAEIDRFLDTPVKRYSSGMYVRLAFAVAAHLEPEILLVDEVLAVGDAAFQRRCLGAMDDAARGGQTALFVSHNMSAIQRLCRRAVWLADGRVHADGPADEVVHRYLAQSTGAVARRRDPSRQARPQDSGQSLQFMTCEVLDADGAPADRLRFGEPFAIRLSAQAGVRVEDVAVVLHLVSFADEVIAGPSSEDQGLLFTVDPTRPLQLEARFTDLVLSPGSYRVTVGARSGPRGLDQVRHACGFDVLESTYGDRRPHSGTWGFVHLSPRWRVL